MISKDRTVLLLEDEFSLSNAAGVSYQWSQRGGQSKTICKTKKARK